MGLGEMSSEFNRKIDKAIELYEQGNLKKARSLCLRLLEKDADNSHVLITLGNIFYVQNDYSVAEKYYQKAADVSPFSYPALVNLANSLYEQKKYAAAAEYARRAAECKSDEKLAYIILGNSYQELEDYDSAVKALTAAAKLDPSDSWIYNYLSQGYLKQQNYLQAISSAWKAVELSADEDDEAHQINLGYLFYEVALDKKADSIADCVKLWLKKYSDNPLVNYMGNALLSNQNIKTANAKYVKDIFDVFAADFDSVLRALDYRAPQLIRKCLEDIYKDKKRPRLKILDLGCGTGLCGEFLKDYAGWFGLDGVDISPKMLEAAKRKKLYSRLINSEMTAYLNNSPDRYNLMVAADVFTYVGDLENLFKAVHKSLKKKGRIIFTISENTQNDKAYYLHISGRFVHAIEYVKFMLNDSLFEIENCVRRKLRNEGDKSVMGYVISAVKK